MYHRAGRNQESNEALDQLIQRPGERWSFEIAEVHAERGNNELAFDWLERAMAAKAAMVCDLNVSLRLAPLHKDSRWKPLVRRLGLADPD